MTNKELVTGFFVEGYVRHNYDFLMEKNMNRVSTQVCFFCGHRLQEKKADV